MWCLKYLNVFVLSNRWWYKSAVENQFTLRLLDFVCNKAASHLLRDSWSSETSVTWLLSSAAFCESLCLLCVCQGGTMLGPPDTVVELGETEVSEEIFMDYLSSLGESTYRSSIRLFFSPSSRPSAVIWRINRLPFSSLLLPAQRWQVSSVRAQLQHLHQRGGSVPDGQVHPLLHHRPSFWGPLHVSVKAAQSHMTSWVSRWNRSKSGFKLQSTS